MAPSLVVALLGAAIGAQVTQMATRFEYAYVGLLLAAIVGVLAGEAIAGISGGGPELGALHPLSDVLAIAGCEVIATTFFIPSRRTPFA